MSHHRRSPSSQPSTAYRGDGRFVDYPYLTMGRPLPPEVFDITKVPWGALRDAELMAQMTMDDEQMFFVLRSSYPRCAALQAVGIPEMQEMVRCYRQNSQCRVAAPWPVTIDEEALLRYQIVTGLRRTTWNMNTLL